MSTEGLRDSCKEPTDSNTECSVTLDYTIGQERVAGSARVMSLRRVRQVLEDPPRFTEHVVRIDLLLCRFRVGL